MVCEARLITGSGQLAGSIPARRTNTLVFKGLHNMSVDQLKHLILKETELMMSSCKDQDLALASRNKFRDLLDLVRNEIINTRIKLIESDMENESSDHNPYSVWTISTATLGDGLIFNILLSDCSKICQINLEDNSIISYLSGSLDDFYPKHFWFTTAEKLTDALNKTRQVISLALEIRATNKVKVRQQLHKLTIVCKDEDRLALDLFKNDILSEVNVEEIEFASESEASKYTDSKVKPNFRSIGSKFKALVPGIKSYLLSANPSHLLNELDSSSKISFVVNNQEVILSNDDVTIEQLPKAGFAANFGKGFVVILDLNISNELKEKTIARDLKSAIQTYRKENKFGLQDKINICFSCNKETQAIILKLQNMFKDQTLTNNISFVEVDSEELNFAIELV